MVDPITGAAVGKAISKAARNEPPELPPDAAKFLDNVSGGARREVGAWLADKVRYRRMKAQMRLLEKAQKHLSDAGRDPREVKWNVLFPLLDAASLEHDETMADRWAFLLANAADPDADEVPPSFPEILKQFTPIDARILDAIFEATNHVDPDDTRGTDEVLRRFKMDVSEPAFSIVVDNLYRLRVVKPHATEVTFAGSDDEGNPYLIDSLDHVEVTALGVAFVGACRRAPLPA